MTAEHLAFGLSAAARLWRPGGSLLSSCTIGSKRARFVCSASGGPKKRVIFLGTPPVAAQALQKLCSAAVQPCASFTIAGVVTQPAAAVGRKRVVTKSAVHQAAEDLSIPTILTPGSARDAGFLDELSTLSPDLCVTVAYGNFLPKAFLQIPRFGTLNIHPSLLPAFRGAAPVQRALEAGVATTGVSVLQTVLKMDAGPLVAVRERGLRGDEQAPELLEELMESGTEALLEVLGRVWDGTAQAVQQDEAGATHAAKIRKEEGRLTFNENARVVHNKVRAFAGWPGTWGDFVVGGGAGAEEGEAGGGVREVVRVKVLETVVLREQGGMCFGVHEVRFEGGRKCVEITCDDGSKIGAVRVQPQGKKAMDAGSFWNGLRGKAVERKRVPH